MAKVLVSESSLSAIADAIRAKSGSGGTFLPSQMAPAITALPSGGGDVVFEPGGANPALIESHAESLTLADTNFPTMTMSTSQQTIKAAVSSAYVSAYFPYQEKDIVVVQQAFCHHVYYDGADGKAELSNSYRVHYTYVSRAKSSTTGNSNRTGTLTVYYLDYLNTSSLRSFASGTYGIYGSCSSCSTSTSGSNLRITIASPTWYGRASTTYCKVANMNKLNTAETTLQWVVDIFSVDHYSTPLGWFVGKRMFDAFDAGTVASLGD